MTPSSKTNNEERDATWAPPGIGLQLQDGVWCAAKIDEVSYPSEGNEHCFQIEEESYWFKHRMDCLLAAMDCFPPSGTFYDLGGGNGFVASRLQQAGREVALLEPGPGAYNAVKRGVSRVIQATLEGANFGPDSLDAAGAFDVIEHLPDDQPFLRSVHAALKPRGRFYCTVPAHRALWSGEDVAAGHFRRYPRAVLASSLRRAGFQIEYVTTFFTWLTLPVLLFRVLPTRLSLDSRHQRSRLDTMRAQHHLPAALSAPVAAVHRWELSRISECRTIAGGSSLLAIARRL